MHILYIYIYAYYIHYTSRVFFHQGKTQTQIYIFEHIFSIPIWFEMYGAIDIADYFELLPKVQRFREFFMIVSERSPQDLSETISTSPAPCEGIVKFRYTLLVNIQIFIVEHTLQD